jgi:hypothetical protein
MEDEHYIIRLWEFSLGGLAMLSSQAYGVLSGALTTAGDLESKAPVFCGDGFKGKAGCKSSIRLIIK